MKHSHLNFYLLPNCIIFVSTLVLLVVSSHNWQGRNPGEVYHYSKTEIKEQKQQSNLTKKYYNWTINNKYLSYFNHTNKMLSEIANPLSIEQFNALYDNGKTPTVWTQFDNLNQALTTTKLSKEVQIKLDWNQLYHQVNLSQIGLFNADSLLLRFYNIVAKLYGVNNMLRLIQSIQIDPQLTVLAKTNYYSTISAINIDFSSNFANANLIKQQYMLNYWSTSSQIIATIHEYAHTLAFYVINSNDQRARFNTYHIPNIGCFNLYQPLQDNKKSQQLCYLNNSVFHDVTNSLTWFINHYNHFNSENDPVKTLFFPFLVVNSRYSRFAWTDNNVRERDDLFAEAFARWLGTTTSHRDFSWEILNKYFMEFFPQLFNLKNGK